jgi:hypothetical protein
MPFSNRILQAALEVLRKAGHNVGENVTLGGTPYVTIDGQLRTFDEVYEMLDHATKKLQGKRNAAS